MWWKYSYLPFSIEHDTLCNVIEVVAVEEVVAPSTVEEAAEEEVADE